MHVNRWSLLWILGIALLVSPARATTFSFGTVDGTDPIASLVLATGSQQVTFTDASNELLIEASVATINFESGAQISGIPDGDVVIQSLVEISSQGFLPDGSCPVSSFPTCPAQATANLLNGLVDDLTITDMGGVFPIVMLSANYNAGIDLSLNDAGGVTQGELSSAFALTGLSDPDFATAFGSQGELDAQLSIALGNLCDTVLRDCGAPLPTEFDDWNASPVLTIIPLEVPEPGAALLVAMAAAGAARRLRRHRS